jgi:uncharacterized protein (TIGR04222 family)
MPSPSDLHGAGFLVFYLPFGLAVLGALVYRQLRTEGTGHERPGLTDPHLIAYLRGGEKEVVHLAVVTLMRRDLLKAEEGWLTAAALDDALVYTPMEKAILSYFSGGPGRVAGACGDPAVRTILNGFEDTLVEQGLLPSPGQNQSRGLALLAALSALWLVAALPTLNGAAGHGYGGVAIAALVFTGVAAWWSFRRRTAAGDRLLADLRELMRGRSAPVERGALGADAALLAAVYGVPILAGVDTGGISTDTRKPNTSCSSAGCGGGTWGGRTDSDGGGDDGGAGGSDGGSCGSSCGGGCGGCGGE